MEPSTQTPPMVSTPPVFREPSSITNKRILLVCLSCIAVVVAAIVVYFTNVNQNEKLQQATDQPGSPVDNITHRKLQNLMEQTQLANPEVLSNSLRFYDIDGDGDQDVLGVIKLTFSDNYSVHLFSTWHRGDNDYSYYDAGDKDFRFGRETQCSIAGLEIGTITLACNTSGHEYATTLRFQNTGVGYYRDVDRHVTTFKNQAGWVEYTSQKGGVQFSHPPDVTVSETTYDIYGALITVVTAVRSNKTLFEIHTSPQQQGASGVIDNAWQGKFIKLSNGTYISRELMTSTTSSEKKGVYYRNTRVGLTNNVGSVFDAYETVNVEHGNTYTLFTPLTSESDLIEIDNVFSSIKYLPVQVTNGHGTIAIKNNTVSLANAVSITIPGNLSEGDNAERITTSNSPNTIAQKEIDSRFINSTVYRPTFLRIGLHPFTTIGGTNSLGGGGYDSEKGGCFGFDKNVITTPERLGGHAVCKFGWGDAGISIQGYYVLDPNRKYILSVTQESGHNSSFISIPSPDMEAMVESVQFLNSK